MDIVTSSSNLSLYQKYIALQDELHRFLRGRNYLPLSLPVLSPALVPESYLEVFETEYRYFETKQKLYLTPSPELFMKRVLTEVGKDCYYLGPAFRNSEPESSRHSGEFVMLEYYKLGASYMDLADELLNLLQALSHVAGPLTIDSKPYSFDAWEVLTVDEAFVRYAGLEKNTIFEAKAFVTAARAMGYTTDGFSYEDLFTQMYVDQVEPHLGTAGRPTLLKDYPREFAALAALNNDGKTAKRFEFYIGGVELGDCYSELTDAVVQKRRFLAEQKKRIDQGLIEHPVDWGFITMLEKGLPDCAGIAIGFERLAMVLLGAESIHDLRLVDVV
jgi:elongation factor P--beta-lysine ligase